MMPYSGSSNGDVERESILFDAPEFSRIELVHGPCLHIAFLRQQLLNNIPVRFSIGCYRTRDDARAQFFETSLSPYAGAIWACLMAVGVAGLTLASRVFSSGLKISRIRIPVPEKTFRG
jgi:hypothetical protein